MQNIPVADQGFLVEYQVSSSMPQSSVLQIYSWKSSLLSAFCFLITFLYCIRQIVVLFIWLPVSLLSLSFLRFNLWHFFLYVWYFRSSASSFSFRSTFSWWSLDRSLLICFCPRFIAETKADVDEVTVDVDRSVAERDRNSECLGNCS